MQLFLTDNNGFWHLFVVFFLNARFIPANHINPVNYTDIVFISRLILCLFFFYTERNLDI